MLPRPQYQACGGFMEGNQSSIIDNQEREHG